MKGFQMSLNFSDIAHIEGHRKGARSGSRAFKSSPFQGWLPCRMARFLAGLSWSIQICRSCWISISATSSESTPSSRRALRPSGVGARNAKGSETTTLQGQESGGITAPALRLLGAARELAPESDRAGATMNAIAPAPLYSTDRQRRFLSDKRDPNLARLLDQLRTEGELP